VDFLEELKGFASYLESAPNLELFPVPGGKGSRKELGVFRIKRAGYSAFLPSSGGKYNAV
jgi:hypothetical protein